MFEPDIVVTARDSTEPFLVVEVKLRPESLNGVEDSIREYMVWNNYSLGMLVAVGEVRVFRNRFTSYGSDSVERIGVYPLRAFDEFAALVAEPLGAAAKDVSGRLELAVQRWLEELPRAPLDDERDDLRRLLVQEVVPYVRDGVVSAAHRRTRLLRASDVRRHS